MCKYLEEYPELVSVSLEQRSTCIPIKLMLELTFDQASAAEFTQTQTRFRLPHNVDLITNCIRIYVLVPMPRPESVRRINHLKQHAFHTIRIPQKSN